MRLPRWLRQAVVPPGPVAPASGVRAEVSRAGLLTADLACGHCHTALRVDAAAETVRYELDRTTRPLMVTDGPRAWLLQWTCPGCGTPSHVSLSMVTPFGP